MSADGPPARHFDVISQLQDQVNGLCSKLFNFLGALQRDAPPSSVKGEGLLAPAGGVDVEAQTELMASEIVESFTAVERLLQQLPPTDKTEAQQLQGIAALQQHNAAAAAELGRELAAAEGRLAQLQTAYGVLADLQLARRGQRLRLQLPEQQQQREQHLGGPSGEPGPS
ncbi:hypothetical protein N2152v2_003142 [Parachlorella kessleri]